MRRGVLLQASKLAAAAVVSLFVVGACGGSGGTPTSAPTATAAAGAATLRPGTADPCTLLTREEIKTAIGVEYGPSVADSYGHCRWFAGTSMVDEGKGTVTVFFAATGTTLESLKSGQYAGGVDTVVRGHPAYWDGIAFGPSMWVDLGTSILVVGIDPLPVGGQAMALHLAELAVDKM